MTGNNETDLEKNNDGSEKKTLTLSRKADGRPVIERDHIQQSFARGRSKTVEVEVKRRRTGSHPHDKSKDDASSAASARGLTGSEFDVRMKALKESLVRQKEEDEKKAIAERERAAQAEIAAKEAALKAEQEAAQEISKSETTTEAAGISEQSIEQPAKTEAVTRTHEAPEPQTYRQQSSYDRGSNQQRSHERSGYNRPERADRTGERSNDRPGYNNRGGHGGGYDRGNQERSGGGGYDRGNQERSGGGGYDRGNQERPTGDRKPYDRNNNDRNERGYQPKGPHQRNPNDRNPQDRNGNDRGPARPNQTKKPFSKDDIKPIVLRANGYGSKPQSSLISEKDSIIVDPILDKNRGEHRGSNVKSRRKPTDEDEAIVVNTKVDAKKPGVKTRTTSNEDGPRKLNRNFISRVLDDESDTKGRSLASMKRARQKHSKQTNAERLEASAKIARDVIIPETITVGELANRMAVRGADVVKSLMNLGMLVTINQVIDADTAELICGEFGHTAKRVADSDIEIGLGGIHEDHSDDLQHRAPVVTVMGHVDHGKTSLLDALRATDVVSGEAGGITQHIGAYQVTMQSGKKITFIDTPGHAAFSEMRARGANATDIVVLVVAADDGIMAQTIEAINHAKAAEVPIVVAINKIDKPDADPRRVGQELLQHGIVLEEFGGDVMSVEVSAKKRMNLEKLEETILLQSEILELKANPNRSGHGVVIEAEIDKGRGTVATVLVQRGTLRIGDVFVAGSEWGRVKALVNDHGQKITAALPSMPVEVLGFDGVPAAGDEFFVVESEQRAREIAEYRHNRIREKQTIVKTKGGMENIMSKIVAGDSKELPLVVKADVQGSLEAIQASVAKLSTDEVSTRVLHGAVGGINESDITLARASGGMIVGFNVRANPQARELARRDGVEIRYYSIIYDVIDDVKALMGGLLAPTLREKYLGSVEIRNVFSISKVDGKVAGCYVTEGLVKRGAKVRVLRDSVVIFEGELKSLKRFKDEVKEAKESYECGIVLENYDDIKVGDVIECFEIESIARQL